MTYKKHIAIELCLTIYLINVSIATVNKKQFLRNKNIILTYGFIYIFCPRSLFLIVEFGMNKTILL